MGTCPLQGLTPDGHWYRSIRLLIWFAVLNVIYYHYPIISITKFSIWIGSVHAYLSQMGMWPYGYFNYRYQNWTASNWTPTPFTHQSHTLGWVLSCCFPAVSQPIEHNFDFFRQTRFSKTSFRVWKGFSMIQDLAETESVIQENKRFVNSISGRIWLICSPWLAISTVKVRQNQWFFFSTVKLTSE